MALLDLSAPSRSLAFGLDEFRRTTAGALASADRPLSWVGHLALWSNLGAGLYLMVAGAWLVPAMGIPRAAVAVFIGAGLGAALVAAAVRLGALENRPGVVLYRAELGESGANLYGVIASFRHLAWGAIQLAMAAEIAATVMSRQGLGGGRPLWAAIFGALVLLMALVGPATVVRRWLVPTAVLTLLIAIVITYSAWSGFGVPAMLTREPSGGWPAMTGAVDIVAALAIISLPVAMDLGRLGRPRGAAAASFVGLAGMTAWFALLGVLFVPALDGRDVAGFLLASAPGILILLLLVVLELDGAFVSLYGLASTARGWTPKVDSTPPIVVGGATVFALGAALLDPFDYGDALLMLGASFAPLLGVLLGSRVVRGWWQRASTRTRLAPGAQVLTVAGSVAPPAPGGLVAWALGFLLYNWAAPLDIPAWTPAMSFLFQDLLQLPFPAGVPGLSATALGFAVSFAVAVLAASMRLRRAEGRPPP